MKPDVVMTRSGVSLGDVGSHERFIFRTSHGEYDRNGNRLGIDCWGYNGNKRLWFVKRE